MQISRSIDTLERKLRKCDCFRSQRGGELMGTSEDLIQRLDVLESEGTLRRLMAEYLEARDFGTGSGIHISKLFTDDGIWEGVGQLADVLGSYQGRDAIERRFSAPLPFSIHLLTNESIIADGDTAVGTWRYLQSTVYKGQAVWIAGHYHNDFVRAEGQWKFQHVRIDAMFVKSCQDIKDLRWIGRTMAIGLHDAAILKWLRVFGRPLFWFVKHLCQTLPLRPHTDDNWPIRSARRWT
jgi:SnoaL-like domain